MKLSPPALSSIKFNFLFLSSVFELENTALVWGTWWQYFYFSDLVCINLGCVCICSSGPWSKAKHSILGVGYGTSLRGTRSITSLLYVVWAELCFQEVALRDWITPLVTKAFSYGQLPLMAGPCPQTPASSALCRDFAYSHSSDGCPSGRRNRILQVGLARHDGSSRKRISETLAHPAQSARSKDFSWTWALFVFELLSLPGFSGKTVLVCFLWQCHNVAQAGLQLTETCLPLLPSSGTKGPRLHLANSLL